MQGLTALHFQFVQDLVKFATRTTMQHTQPVGQRQVPTVAGGDTGPFSGNAHFDQVKAGKRGSTEKLPGRIVRCFSWHAGPVQTQVQNWHIIPVGSPPEKTSRRGAIDNQQTTGGGESANNAAKFVPPCRIMVTWRPATGTDDPDKFRKM